MSERTFNPFHYAGTRVEVNHYGYGIVLSTRKEKYKDGTIITWISVRLDVPVDGVYKVEVEEAKLKLLQGD